MRKILVACFLAAFLLSVASPAYCDTHNNPLRKLGRGIWNVLTFPFELPNRIDKVWKKGGVNEGLTYGFCEGVSMMVARGAAGMFEVATFLFPIPPKYEPFISDPEFFFWN